MHKLVLWKLIPCLMVLLLLVDTAQSDYENTWNFYYEQPCCGNTNGQHHLRHHREFLIDLTTRFLRNLKRQRLYNLEFLWQPSITFNMNVLSENLSQMRG
uniref:Uncharacterized protein n=1 Tax=Phlebotomus papatasi TaxID=29031 RepID=A0A1B0CZW5_PHLPP